MNTIVKGVTNRLALPLLKAQKHSPAMLFAGGVVGVVATVVLASRATLKMGDVLEEHEKDMASIDERVALDEEFSKDEKAQQKVKVAVLAKTSLNVVKLYGPAVLVGAASIAALTGSHYILKNRLTSVTAAYATLDGAFRKYRGRVVEKYGKSTDDELFFGTQTVDEETDVGDGIKKTKKVKKVLGPNGYAVLFEEGNKNWKPGPGYNSMFIQSQQNWANIRLQGEGFLFLNDVYDMLGFPRTSAGQQVGWVKKTDRGDGYIDFGVLENDHFNGIRFINGDESACWLDFNVDGVILDLIDHI